MQVGRGIGRLQVFRIARVADGTDFLTRGDRVIFLHAYSVQVTVGRACTRAEVDDDTVPRRTPVLLSGKQRDTAANTSAPTVIFMSRAPWALPAPRLLLNRPPFFAKASPWRICGLPFKGHLNPPSYAKVGPEPSSNVTVAKLPINVGREANPIRSSLRA